MIENYNKQVNKIIKLGDQILSKTNKKGKLTNYSYISLGGTPSRKHPEYWNGDIKWINSGAMTGNPAVFYESEFISELGVRHSATKCASSTDTVLSIIDPSKNKISIILDDCIYFNQSVICLSANNKKNAGLIYFATRALIDEIKGFATGAAQQSLNKEMFELSEIYIPSDEDVSKLEYFMNQIMLKELSIKTLKELKQELLLKYF